ncbi:MAG: hypothetical protein ACXADL_12700 [Candidatus Thorarchaeota archaeon]|jgi:hypothetical protein
MAIIKYESYEEITPSELGSAPIGDAGDAAQAILTTSAHQVDKCLVYVNINGAGQTGTLNFGFYATTAGVPSGSPLGSGSLDISGFVVTTNWNWEELVFDTPFSVNNATLYSIVLFGDSITGANQVNWAANFGPTFYTDGDMSQRASGSSTDPVTGFTKTFPGGISMPFQVWGNDTPVTAPTPDPATFSVAPTALGATSITMTATTGTTSDPPVSYYFAETSGNPGGADRGWSTDSSYTNIGLTAETEYTYTVQMRDASLVTGDASAPASATTGKSAVDLVPYNTNKRAIMVCNNVVWYEDI